MQTKKILFGLFILFILIRLPFLDQLNLLHDERDIALSGWSIAQTGRDLNGLPFPLYFKNISPNNPLFAIYFAAVWFFFVPFKSVFMARLPFLLISSLLVFLSFKIIKFITKEDKKALITTAILCFNPWIFHITRLALDIPLALVFLFSGILFYLQKRKYFAFIFFFLTAFTYQGSRLLLPFLLIYLEFYSYLKNKSLPKLISGVLFNLIFFIFLFFLSGLLEPSINTGRLSEIIFFDSQKTAPTVDFKRMTTLAPLFVSKFFDNKITYSIEEMIVSFTRGSDLSYLFKSGDYSPLNGNASTGQFFFVFILFYFLGIASLGRKISPADLYLLGLIPLGMVPTLLSTRGLTFSIRGVLSSLGYSYLIALGILFFRQLLFNFKFKNYIYAATGFVLLLNLSYFIYGYYFRRPVTVGELFSENERQLANYLLTNTRPLTVFHQSPRDMLLSYAFFNNRNLNIADVQKALQQNNYQYKNLAFRKCNHKVNYLQSGSIIVHEPCLEKKAYDLLSDISNPRIKTRIPYRDFSQKTAYFVIE